MNTEEVIKILDPESSAISAMDIVEKWEDLKEMMFEAHRMAISALRAQQSRTLDRSRWKGCDHCKGDLEGYTACFRDANGRSRKLYIPEGEAAIVAPGTYNHKFYIPIKYCPMCGRPLTEAAWAELERRIGSGEENS